MEANRISLLKQKSGVTFIELLVGITIFAILSLAVFNALSLGLKVTKITQTQLQITHKIDRFLNTLTNELHNAVLFYVSEEDIVGFKGREKEISFFCIKDGYNQTIVDLRFISRVGYSFQDNHLFKSQRQGEDLLEALEYTQEIDAPIKDLKFSYFNKPQEKEKAEFEDDWPETKKDLPFGVNIELTLLDEKQKKETVVSKQIFLPLKVF